MYAKRCSIKLDRGSTKCLLPIRTDRPRQEFAYVGAIYSDRVPPIAIVVSLLVCQENEVPFSSFELRTP
jgi:hypothetical protein